MLRKKIDKKIGISGSHLEKKLKLYSVKKLAVGAFLVNTFV